MLEKFCSGSSPEFYAQYNASYNCTRQKKLTKEKKVYNFEIGAWECILTRITIVWTHVMGVFICNVGFGLFLYYKYFYEIVLYSCVQTVISTHSFEAKEFIVNMFLRIDRQDVSTLGKFFCKARKSS